MISNSNIAESPLWLNIDKPLKSLVIHFQNGCSDERRKGRGKYKPVGMIGRDGGWIPFNDYTSAYHYSQEKWGHFPTLRYCSNCTSKIYLADLGELAEEEGRRRLVTHHRIERSPKIISAKRKAVLRDIGKLACEVCAFDFSNFYGPIGVGFCEVHHLIPLSELVHNRKTKLDDLAIVCSNCHRMVHRRRICLTIDELRREIKNT